VSSKNFSIEFNFDEDHLDYVCYDDTKPDGEKWYQGKKEWFFDEEGDYVVNEKHWTFNHDKPGHALQDEVSRVLSHQLSKFYGLDATT